MGLQSILQGVDFASQSRRTNIGAKTLEVRVLDVVPLTLDTVHVTVDKDMLKNLDEIQRKFGGGFGDLHNGYGSKGKGKPPPQVPSDRAQRQKSSEDRLTDAVRKALTASHVVRSGDLLPLPLPAHPITHVPAPPGLISHSEPVSQGVVGPSTKVVVVQQRQSPTGAKPTKQMKGLAEDEAEDTSNEQFYSAAEDRSIETETEDTSVTETSDTETSENGGSDLSDDSMDEMISMSAPGLPSNPSGAMSAMTAATPRPLGSRTGGIGTPGSVFSNYTSTTARPSERRGKIFKTQSLLQRVPIDAIHPKPSSEDDDDAFVFVDVNTLVKLGCFSGDWARIEVAEPPVNPFASLNIGNMNMNSEGGDWRTVRVFGLPGISASKPRYAVNRSGDRRSSFSSLLQQSPTATAYLSPILLANMQNAKHVRLSPMAPQRKSTSTRPQLQVKAPRIPPTAKEMSLSKIATPLSMERPLQQAMFTGLKQYLEQKKRLLKTGDLIGISVDTSLGSILHSTGDGEEDSNEELTYNFGRAHQQQSRTSKRNSRFGVAWFRVNRLVPAVEGHPDEEDDIWGGVAVVDAASTRTAQDATEISRLPSTMDNTWDFYLGSRPLPPSSSTSQDHNLAEKPKVYGSSLQKRIYELASAATSPKAVNLGMDPIVILLTSNQRHIGKATVATLACSDLGIHAFQIDAYDILADAGAAGGDVKTEGVLKARAERAFSCGATCTALVLRHIEVLTADRMVSALTEIVQDSRLVIATTTDVEKIADGVRGLFTHELQMTAPDESEREGILESVVTDRGVSLSPDVDLAAVALKSAALVAGDLVDVVERAVVAKRTRLEALVEAANQNDETSNISLRDVEISGGEAARCVTKVDFEVAIDAARKNFADAIGAPKIPNVSWDDVGGLTNVKDAVMETIQLPLERPELFSKGMKKRSGILFYGPPGTGKTLLAKAIATEFSLNFFSVKGPELLNMYIGESEANVRRVFQRARDARPCVVFFDELDSVAPKRGNQGDSGGVMDRIVSQLLAELDGMSDGDDNGGGVFVIGATNRPDLLDQALLRPGRFDKMLYLGVSDTHDKQLTILEALTRKFTLHPDMSLRKVADSLPLTYTGADLYALCSDAMLKAVTRQATAVDDKIKALPGGPVTTAYFFDHLATKEDVAVMVEESDFFAAQNELVGSVRYVHPPERGQSIR